MESKRVADGSTEAGSRQYVTFSLNNELYALEAMRVQEILALTGVTRVPHLPEYFRGVINLRGAIIPVVDMKRKFNMSVTEFDKTTCVIVTEFSGGVIGMIVDSVSDVMHIAEADVTAAPSFGEKIRTDFITSMGKTREGIVIILDIEKVLSADDVLSLDEARLVAGQIQEAA